MIDHSVLTWRHVHFFQAAAALASCRENLSIDDYVVTSVSTEDGFDGNALAVHTMANDRLVGVTPPLFLVLSLQLVHVDSGMRCQPV